MLIVEALPYGIAVDSGHPLLSQASTSGGAVSTLPLFLRSLWAEPQTGLMG